MISRILKRYPPPPPPPLTNITHNIISRILKRSVPWNLDRLNQQKGVLDGSYKDDADVDVYILGKSSRHNMTKKKHSIKVQTKHSINIYIYIYNITWHKLTDPNTVFTPRDTNLPIWSRYSHHITQTNQSEHGINITWHKQTNQSTLFTPRDTNKVIRTSFSPGWGIKVDHSEFENRASNGFSAYGGKAYCHWAG